MTRPSSNYDASKPGGPGIDEKQIHSGSGLRTACLSGVMSSDHDAIVDAFVPADQTTFTPMTIVTGAGRLPLPMTPAITYNHLGVSLLPKTMQFRIKGYDQFGNFITELLPQVTFTPTDDADISVQMASKVFAHISEVAYTLSGFETNDVIDVGWRFIWHESVFDDGDGGDNTSHGLRNIGIGTPVKMAPYGGALGETQQGQAAAMKIPDILGITCYNVTNGTAIVVPPYNNGEDAGFRVGLNAAGYQGTPHKVSLFLGEIGSAGTFPTTAGGTDDLAEADLVIIHINARATAGTARTNSPKSSYPK